MLGVVQCRLGRFKDAVYLLEELAEEGDDVAVLLALAAAYFGTEQFQKAQSSLAAALRADPASSEAHYNMVRVLFAVKPFDVAKARHHYKKALTLGGAPDPAFGFLLK